MDRINRIAQPMRGERSGHEIPLPIADERIAGMLQRAAAAGAEMRAGRGCAMRGRVRYGTVLDHISR